MPVYKKDKNIISVNSGKGKMLAMQRPVNWIFISLFITTLAIIVLFIANSVWTNQKNLELAMDRPFIDETYFVKSDYSSGCLIMRLVMCAGPEVTLYVYETDLSLDKIVAKFPKWEVYHLESEGDKQTVTLKNIDNSELAVVWFINNYNINDQKLSSKITSNMKNKKSIFYLEPESYRVLVAK